MLMLGLLTVLLAIPMGVYQLATRRSRNEWTVFEKVPTPIGGAYRGGWTWIPRDAGAPMLVQVASVWSFALLGPALLSLPMMLMGMAEEAESKNGSGIGPAAIFGPTGFLLAVSIFTAGWKLFKRREHSRRFARGVALWSVMHNVAVVIAVIASTTSETPGGWRDFDIHALGWVALVYATVSFAHAFTLLAATQTHERIDAAHPADVADLVDDPNGVYASAP